METINNYPILFRSGQNRCTRELHTFTTRYYEKFLKWNCALDLLSLRLYEKCKEITESMAAYEAVLKEILPPNDSVLVSFGDGSRPRTAALFAFRTPFECFSVDPLLHSLEAYQDVKRLTCLPSRAEEVVIDCQGKHAVALFVHSHVAMKDALPSLKNYSGLSVVVIKCCKELDQGYRSPDITYYDAGIESPERRVDIWKQL